MSNSVTARVEAVIESLHGSSSADNSKQDNHNGNHQQSVNQTAYKVYEVSSPASHNKTKIAATA
jgi:hypothetical protein